MSIEEIASQTLNSAFRVHSQLGPGLLESADEACLWYDLTKAGLRALRQVPQPILYDSLQRNEGYRLDLLVEESIIIEIKAVEKVSPVHHLQLKTYLKLSRKTLGFLINFNVPLLKEGVHRMVLNHPESKGRK
ncbi:MAG TPA: GxxExxY protein [Verrucomicrobiae bacterium]|nr:GxxExxY protein [Verrucomicrobiae bacterium]